MITYPCNKCSSRISERLFKLNNWICNYCLNKPIEINKTESTWININEIKAPVISPNIIPSLPRYSSSYINNKLKKNYKSIINERCCIKVWEDSYILHSDIINSYKLNIK